MRFFHIAIAVLLSLSSILASEAASLPITLALAPNGYKIEIDCIPLTNDRNDRTNLTPIVNLMRPHEGGFETVSHATLPFRFDPSQIGEILVAWSTDSKTAAFILLCKTEGEDDERSRLFVFRIVDSKLVPVALPNVETFLSRKKNFINLSTEPDQDYLFSWVDERTLIVRYSGTCRLEHDIDHDETRELHCFISYNVDEKGQAVISNLLKLQIQG